MEFEIFGRDFSFFGEERQIEKALDMLQKYFFKPEIIILSALIIAYFIFRIAAWGLKNEKMRNTGRRLSPWVYLIFILGVTLFNRNVGVRTVRFAFNSWIAGNGRFHESTILMDFINLLLYMPYGYFLVKDSDFNKKYLTSVGIVAVTSFGVEIFQYVFALGVASVEDVFFNVLGGCAGIALAALLSKRK